MSADRNHHSAVEFLTEHTAAMTDDLRRLVEQESPSDDRALLNDLAAFLAGYAGETGGRPEMVSGTDGSRHLRVAWGRGGDPPTLLLGHYDTVWPAGTLARMPFHIDGNRAYGPGSFDMKAGIVQGFWALRALRETNNDPPVVFLLTSDEETGSHGSRSLIEREAAAAERVFVLEPSHQGALKTARKGVGQYRITITGRASHAGLAPQDGISAIDELAHLILRLHALSDAGTGSTVNVGVVSGGTRSNVVAAEATADVDVRFFTQSEADRLAEAIESLTPNNQGITLRIAGGINRPPLERTAASGALFEQARAAAARLGFDLAEVAVGGASDGNFCSALGVPVLDGLGAVGSGAHALDEHVILDEMPRRAALLAASLAG